MAADEEEERANAVADQKKQKKREKQGGSDVVAEAEENSEVEACDGCDQCDGDSGGDHPSSAPCRAETAKGGSAEEHALRSLSLLDTQEYAGAALEAQQALDCLPLMAKAALTRGRALLHPVLAKMVEEDELPPKGLLDEAWRAFTLAARLDPECRETKAEIENLQGLLKGLPSPTMPASTSAEWDVIIVGAGAAGIGTALMLTRTFGLDPARVLLIERGETVGDTFRRWPAEMRFISPSFNQQGWTSSFDLNSIAHGTSPAYSLHAEHPTGGEYADYLHALAVAAKLRVRLHTEVMSVQAVGATGAPPLFSVGVRTVTKPFHESRILHSKPGAQAAKGRPARATEKLSARYVVWAAGEFQYPKESSGAVEGAELCHHNSRVRSWANLPGDEFVLIGGYESGADAAINLAKAGKRATVLASSATWDICTSDPSAELAPYTNARLRDVTASGFSPRPTLLAPLRVLRVERAAAGGFNVHAVWKAAEKLPEPGPLRKPLIDDAEAAGGPADASTPAGAEGSELVLHTPQPPVLCTGFEGSVAAAARHLFQLAGESDGAKGCLAGAPLLTADDESTIVPGVFLAGPSVVHGELSFCFIYKFRQRFGIVANAICRGLGRDTESAVEVCRQMNMYLDDFKCCKTTCGETC